MDLFKNSRGSIAIFVVLGLILLVGAIAGGTFYVKSNYFGKPADIASENSTEDTNISSSSAITNNINQSQAAKSPSPSSSILPGKIYYLTQVQAEVPMLKTVNPNKNDSQTLTNFYSILRHRESFDSLVASPDRSVTLIRTLLPIPDHTPLDIKSNGGVYYYLLSKDGSVKMLDHVKIVTPFVDSKIHRPGELTISGFSLDGKKLIGSILLLTWEGKREEVVIDYDLTSGQTKELFRLEGTFRAYFYDSAKQIIAYQTLKPQYELAIDGPNNSLGKWINLHDKTTTNFDYPISNISNQSDDPLTNFINGNPNFIKVAKNPEYIPLASNPGSYEIAYKNRRTLFINSFYNPASNGVEITLDAPADMTYGKQVLWSPDFNYFAITVNFNTPQLENNQIYIYSKEGKFISKAEVAARDFFHFGSFSPDNRYLLINTYGSWKIFDIKEQKYIKDDTRPSGIALYWEP